MLCNISFDGFAVALSGREVLACERASELTFNPLAPILGGKSGNWGAPLILRRVYDQTLGIRLRRTAPLHTPTEMQETSCRESEGVPQIFFFSIPQEWGIKGVEDLHLGDQI
jgi:hypothetical protein